MIALKEKSFIKEFIGLSKNDCIVTSFKSSDFLILISLFFLNRDKSF